MKKAQKDQCKECPSHWVHGIKDGEHNNWCCKFGRSAPKAYKHCINTLGITWYK